MSTKKVTIHDLITSAMAESGIAIQSDVLQLALASQVEDRKKQMVEAVKGLLGTFDSYLKHNVQRLREIRQQEKEQEANVKKVSRAFSFFAETGNPLPMFKAVGDMHGARNFCNRGAIPVPKQDDPAWEVPADFNVSK